VTGPSLGRVLRARAGVVQVQLPASAVGEAVEICAGHAKIFGVVQSVGDGIASLAVQGSIEGVMVGDAVRALPGGLTAPLGMVALGRAIDAQGTPIDCGPDLRARRHRMELRAPAPAERRPPKTPLWTGIKAVDALMTIARGARVGIFGAPGVGKSTLLSTLARGIGADAIVIGLIGERGREAAEWVRHISERATIVCASSDRSAVERAAAARTAMAQATVLRARGLHVLLILDSLARLAAALREIAVACGEPVGRGSFAASVFAQLASFVEVAGQTARGSITLIATILTEGVDERDPISEAARSLLDGHIHLSLALAHAGRYPAVDVAASASRLMPSIITAEHARDAQAVRRAIAALGETEDARSLGLPQRDPWVVAAQAHEPSIELLLRQDEEPVPAARTLAELHRIAHSLVAETALPQGLLAR